MTGFDSADDKITITANVENTGNYGGRILFRFGAKYQHLEFIKSWGWMDVDYFEVETTADQKGNSFNNVCNREVEIRSHSRQDLQS